MEFQWWYYMIVLALLVTSRLIIKKQPKPNLVVEVIFVTYVLTVIQVTFFPIYKPTMAIFEPEHNFVPFQSILTEIQTTNHMIIILKQIGGNAIMLMPFGFLLPFVIRSSNFKKVFIYGLLFAVGIEMLQWFISYLIQYNYRSFDIDDIILNITGCMVGYCLYWVVKNCKLLMPFHERSLDA